MVVEESQHPLLIQSSSKFSHGSLHTSHSRKPNTPCGHLLPMDIATSLHRHFVLSLLVLQKAGEMHSAQQGGVSRLPHNYICESAAVEKTNLEGLLLRERFLLGADPTQVGPVLGERLLGELSR